jgi:outer membrane protein assembly factor BamB
MHSPYTGTVFHAIKNAPTDISDYGWAVKFDDGSPIVWVVQANPWLWNTTKPLKIPYVYLIKWNITKLVKTGIFGTALSDNWKDGIEWNVTAQTGDLVDIGDCNWRVPEVFPYYGAGVVIVRNPNAMQIMAGFDMETGKLLWKNNATVLSLDVLPEGVATSPYGPHLIFDGASPNLVAYDVKTGKEIWRAPTGELPWAMLPAYEYVYHNGVHYFGSYDGHVYAYNSTNGKLVWKSDYIGESWEYIYGNAPITSYAGGVGADGKLYFCTTNIYNMMPRTRFHWLVCINETTGKFIWKLPIGIAPLAVADGYLIGIDQDNGIMYCIGEGKTSTTVSVQNDVVAAGSGVLIKGSVMDMSPGAPNTPAVSDADMSVWMDYLYGQNATLLNDPPKPKGVPVSLYAIDANGAQVHIGDVTTDWTGTFKTLWTPENPGVYTIIAVFAGSESYWPSYGATAIGVTEAPVQPEVPQAPAYNTIDLVIIAAVAVVAVLVVYTIYTVRKLARK